MLTQKRLSIKTGCHTQSQSTHQFRIAKGKCKNGSHGGGNATWISCVFSLGFPTWDIQMQITNTEEKTSLEQTKQGSVLHHSVNPTSSINLLLSSPGIERQAPSPSASQAAFSCPNHLHCGLSPKTWTPAL